MGIPGFFSWILHKCVHDNILINKINEQIDTLYIDANCLFHPQCIKITTLSKETNTEILEELMIQRIINYVTYIIEFVMPKMVYISVDGVAPVAKVNQQRVRRYKSYKDTQIKNEIKQKFGIDTKSKWSNIVITPATQFMEKLHKSLKKHLINYSKEKKMEIIYSSYHTPGEGEHKILDHLKSAKSKNNIIYGLDADLIFLAMVCQNKHIYLLREANILNSAVDDEDINIINDVIEPLLYVDIDILKGCFNNMVNEMIQMRANVLDINVIHQKSLINDITFVFYFLGNDFIPHLPTIDIKKDGIEILLGCYVDTYVKYQKPLVTFVDDKVNIDMIFLDNFINQLSTQEKCYFEEVLPMYSAKIQNKKCFHTDEYEKEIWDLENMRLIESYDVFQLGYGNMEDWKFRYYEHYFGCTEYQDEQINDLCINYLDGIMWVTKYYFEKCPSWTWAYNYSHAPFLSDLSKFIRNSRYDINNKIFKLNSPLKPLTQLMSVIPPIYCNILPKSYTILMTSSKSPLLDLFPSDVELDLGNKDLFWKCIPLLPYLDIDRINEETKKIINTPNDEERNTLYDDIHIKN